MNAALYQFATPPRKVVSRDIGLDSRGDAIADGIDDRRDRTDGIRTRKHRDESPAAKPTCLQPLGERRRRYSLEIGLRRSWSCSLVVVARSPTIPVSPGQAGRRSSLDLQPHETRVTSPSCLATPSRFREDSNLQTLGGDQGRLPDRISSTLARSLGTSTQDARVLVGLLRYITSDPEAERRAAPQVLLVYST